jgi:hypothetical protein
MRMHPRYVGSHETIRPTAGRVPGPVVATATKAARHADTEPFDQRWVAAG